MNVLLGTFGRLGCATPDETVANQLINVAAVGARRWELTTCVPAGRAGISSSDKYCTRASRQLGGDPAGHRAARTPAHRRGYPQGVCTPCGYRGCRCWLYGVASWVRRRFMISCVVSGSMPKSRRAMLTHPARRTRADTASARRHRALRAWWARQVPGRRAWPVTIGECGLTRQLSWPARSSGLTGRGDLKRPLLEKPTREWRHGTLAVRRRRRPVILPQHPLRQAAVLPGTRQPGQRVRYSPPTHTPRQRKTRRFHGSCREDPVTCSLADTSFGVR
jgi:hypothetical protein